MADDLHFPWDGATQGEAALAIEADPSAASLRASLPLRLALVGALTETATIESSGEADVFRVDLSRAVDAMLGADQAPDYTRAKLEAARALATTISLIWQAAGEPPDEPASGDTGFGWPVAAAIAVGAVAAVAGLAWFSSQALPVIDRAIQARQTVRAMADADKQLLRLTEQVQRIEEEKGETAAADSPAYQALLGALDLLSLRQKTLAENMPEPAAPPSSWSGMVWPLAIAASVAIALYKFG